MLPCSSYALVGLLARQRAHLLASAAQRHLTTTTSASAAYSAEYAPSAVGGPGSGGDAGGGGGGGGGVSASPRRGGGGPPAVRMRATTILAVRLGGEVVLIGDGQATANDFVVKPNVRKLRRLGPVAPPPAAETATTAATTTAATTPTPITTPTTPTPTTTPRLSETAAAASPVVAGFAGLAADGLALLDRLDAQVRAHPGQLRRAAVELAKAWRQDRALRELDAAVLVADSETTLWLAGNGDVLESADGVVAVGSGSDFAEAAARALIDAQADGAGGGGRADLCALDIARRAMRVAADSCVYTNHRWTWCRLRKVHEEGGHEGGGGGGAGGAAAGAEGARGKAGAGGKAAPAATVVVDEGSEDGLVTTAGPPEPTHGGDVV